MAKDPKAVASKDPKAVAAKDPKTVPTASKSSTTKDKSNKAVGANSDKKTEMTEKAQLVDKLRQQIKLQNKTNAANLRNCRLCTVAAFLLAILLAVQVVNSNSYLKKLITWKNTVDTTVTIIDTGSKKAVEIQEQSGKLINDSIDKSKKWYDD